MPNIYKTTIDDRKFTHYLFGGNNERGLIKGKLITEKFRHDINNYNDLKKYILSRVKTYPSVNRENRYTGTRYEQRIFIYDKNGMPINLKISWFIKGNQIHMTTNKRI